MLLDLDVKKVVCDECNSAVVIYVEKDHHPILREELGGYLINPVRSDRNYEYHLCPACQRKRPKLKVMQGGLNE